MFDNEYLSSQNNLYGYNKKITLDTQQLTVSEKESFDNQEIYQKIVLNELLSSKEIQSKIYEFGERIAKLETNLENLKDGIKENKVTKRFSITTFLSIISLILTILLTINTFFPFANKIFTQFPEQTTSSVKK